MKTFQVTPKARRATVIAEQEQWIITRGGTLEGYIAKHGERGAVYHARDTAYLHTLKGAK